MLYTVKNFVKQRESERIHGESATQMLTHNLAEDRTI